MKKIKLSRLAILALFAKKDEGKFFTHVTVDKELLMISPSLMDMCKDNLIRSVEFQESGDILKSKDGTELKTFKVVTDSIEESNAKLIPLAATIKSQGLTQNDIDLAKTLL